MPSFLRVDDLEPVERETPSEKGKVGGSTLLLFKKCGACATARLTASTPFSSSSGEPALLFAFLFSRYLSLSQFFHPPKGDLGFLANHLSVSVFET
ncbi:MAG: hypothetical protein WED07_14305 [Candidatus Freyarchaeum deiterrae]